MPILEAKAQLKKSNMIPRGNGKVMLGHAKKRMHTKTTLTTKGGGGSLQIQLPDLRVQSISQADDPILASSGSMHMVKTNSKWD